MNEEKNKVYTFSIGQNNKTKKREMKKALRVFNEHKIKGLTLSLSVGYWLGVEEKSFIITVLNNEYNPFNDNKARIIKKELENKLKQDLVLLTVREETTL